MFAPSVREIAAMIDHALLHPTLSDAGLEAGCLLAARLKVASVCVKPHAVGAAVGFMAESAVRVGTVVGFPHGSSSTRVKVFETEAAIDAGATEIDFVINVGKALGGDWTYVDEEIKAVNHAATAAGAIAKVIFETAYFEDAEALIRLCHFCNDAGVAFVKTSTGFGFIHDEAGNAVARGATEADVRLMREHTSAEIGVKASGGIRTLDDVLRFRQLGATRVGTSSTEAILEEACRRLPA